MPHVIASPASFPMSLRGHPKEAAAISPSSVKYLQTRGDCHVAALLAMTWCPFVPASTRRLRSLLRAQERSLLPRCAPRNDMVSLHASFPMSLRVLPLTGAHQKCHSRLTCPRPNRGAGIHPPKADNDHPWIERESFSRRTLFKTVLTLNAYLS